MSETINLIDTHAHLDFEDLRNNINDVLAKCEENGVRQVIVPGVTLEDQRRVLDLVEQYDNLFAAVGVHPSEAKSWTDTSYAALKAFASHPKVVAIGEIGLDYYWDKSFVEEQKHVFKEQIRLAKELGKPVIVHDREAHGDVLAILKETDAASFGGVMHCFSGSLEFALECTKLGLYIALGGPVTFKNAHKPKEVAAGVPLDKLVLETDSPFLTPHPFRGQQNDPSKVRLVAEEIARLRNISLKELADATSSNASGLFKI